MSEFDKLKDDAEKYAQDHPEQVQKGEQAAEKKLGLPGQENSGSGQQDQSGQDQPVSQDQSGQGGQYDQGAGPGGEDQQNSGERRRPVARALTSRLAARPAGRMLSRRTPCTTARSPEDRSHTGRIVTGDGQNRGGAAGPPPTRSDKRRYFVLDDHLRRLVRHLVGGRGPLLSPRVGHHLAGGAGDPAVCRHHRERDQRHRPPPVTVRSRYGPLEFVMHRLVVLDPVRERHQDRLQQAVTAGQGPGGELGLGPA